jgi:hypothetical protein
MTTAAASGRAVARRGHGWIVFAGIMMVIAGVVNVLNALWAFDHDNTSVDALLYSSSLTGWGWLYLILGIGLIVVGISIFRGAVWAMWTGIIVAAVAAMLNVLWIFAYPISTLVLIGLSILVIYALMVHGVGSDELV